MWSTKKEYLPFIIFDENENVISFKSDTPIKAKRAVKKHFLMSRKFDDITNYDYWDNLIEQLRLSDIELWEENDLVKLKNVIIDGNIAKCDIYPEDSKDKGTLEVNLQTREIIGYTLPVGYEWCENHIAHAKRSLLEISESKEIPGVKTVAWY